MRMALNARARRLVRRVPHTTVYSLLELGLLSLLAVQGARLVWILVSPVGPVGEWQAPNTLAAAPVALAAGEFDPFFRLQGTTGPVTVTALSLRLTGVREDRASGRGSAIIALPDGSQRSFGIGEEIVPGVTLAAVGFDNVTLSRGGTPEQLFLDQSGPAAIVPGGPPTAPPPVAPMPGIVAPQPTAALVPAAAGGSAAADIAFRPRLNGAEITGVTVQPQGSGNAFRAAGLAPGDVILSVDGRRIRSADQIRSIASQISGAREVNVQVERDGRVIPLRMRVDQ
ncbi:type II secretion system protein N [Sphingomonas sp. LY54]|uniref:type II secretion system protein N n=1 Tax=Sphingomonas sp. LY54 TaxID=3095343 RepID=UPI002D79A49D|nr:type II secretion system protein N [Sphingomonas sp. LY54]WRP29259.1 type II secretion system protein N [Sphingomonas sp. LY54]